MAQSKPGSHKRSPRRSLLFTPGDSQKKILKAVQVVSDTVILDLEDAVAVDQKDTARQTVLSTLEENRFRNKECMVRVNAVDSEFFAADLEVVTSANIDGIVLPKVESAEQVQQVDQLLSTSEISSGRQVGAIRLFVLIETARAVLNIKEIVQSCARLDGLLFGAEDLALDLGAVRTKDGWEIYYGRSAVVTAAAAYQLEAVDTVFVDINNLDGLREDALLARQMGYTGKMAIHPLQVEIINEVFSPSLFEIAQAERLLEAYRAHLAKGTGVFTLDGRMIDRPQVQAAERILEKAQPTQPLV